MSRVGRTLTAAVTATVEIGAAVLSFTGRALRADLAAPIATAALTFTGRVLSFTGGQIVQIASGSFAIVGSALTVLAAGGMSIYPFWRRRGRR